MDIVFEKFSVLLNEGQLWVFKNQEVLVVLGPLVVKSEISFDRTPQSGPDRALRTAHLAVNPWFHLFEGNYELGKSFTIRTVSRFHVGQIQKTFALNFSEAGSSRALALFLCRGEVREGGLTVRLHENLPFRISIIHFGLLFRMPFLLATRALLNFLSCWRLNPFWIHQNRFSTSLLQSLVRLVGIWV